MVVLPCANLLNDQALNFASLLTPTGLLFASRDDIWSVVFDLAELWEERMRVQINQAESSLNRPDAFVLPLRTAAWNADSEPTNSGFRIE
jgi:hypothetical protein